MTQDSFGRHSCPSPERHGRVDLLGSGFDAALVLRQALHFLHRFLDHCVPAAHLVQVPFQRLIQKPDGHGIVLHVAVEIVAGVLQLLLGLRDLVQDLEGGGGKGLEL